MHVAISYLAIGRMLDWDPGWFMHVQLEESHSLSIYSVTINIQKEKLAR